MIDTLIPQQVIEELRERIDLVQVVEQITPVKRVGSSVKACCPFHEEKTPSFHVSPSKQLFHCFGCGAGGNVYHFLMRYYHFAFPEALEYVAKEVGFDLEPYEQKDQNYQQEQEIRNVLLYAKDKFHDFLIKNSKAKTARDYLTQRKISPELIESYGLGFVPEGWDNLTQALQRDGQSLENATKAGLTGIKKAKKEYFDVFRNRLMIPIHDAKGGLIGFGARTMSDENPKYLNSPQTIFFDKSKILFGLHRAEHSIRQNKNVYIVEGYFDQMSLFDAGIENVVATMGTATTGYHCAVLKRYTSNITLVFDGDKAGVQACKKAAKSILAFGLDANVKILPQGVDPDDFVRAHGRKAFEALPTEPLLSFLIQQFYTDATELQEKTQFLQEMVEIVGNAQSPYIARVLKDELMAALSLDATVFKEKPAFEKPKEKVNVTAPSSSPMQTTEALMALVLYAQNTEIQGQMNKEQFLGFIQDQELFRLASESLGQEISPKDPIKWIDHWDDPAYKALLAKVLVSLDTLVENQAWEKVWTDCFSKLKKQYVRMLAQKIQIAESTGQLQEVELLSKQMMETKKFEPVVTK